MMQRPAWVLDSQSTQCARCKVGFSFFRRRHHCRMCGDIFCDTCSTNRHVMPWDPSIGKTSATSFLGMFKKQTSAKLVRTCDLCSTRLRSALMTSWPEVLSLLDDAEVWASVLGQQTVGALVQEQEAESNQQQRSSGKAKEATKVHGLKGAKITRGGAKSKDTARAGSSARSQKSSRHHHHKSNAGAVAGLPETWAVDAVRTGKKNDRDRVRTRTGSGRRGSSRKNKERRESRSGHGERRSSRGDRRGGEGRESRTDRRGTRVTSIEPIAVPIRRNKSEKELYKRHSRSRRQRGENEVSSRH